MTLNDIKPGQTAFVHSIHSDGGSLLEGFKVRLHAMGLINDKPVRVLRSAMLGGPLQVRVGSTTEIAIRRSEAQLVNVKLTD